MSKLKKKKTYESPTIEVISVEQEAPLVCTSGGGFGNPGNPGNGGNPYGG